MLDGKPYLFPREAFPFIPALESSYPKIRQELDHLIDSCNKYYADAPFINWRKYGTGRWDMFSFYAYGNRIDKMCDMCPITAKCLDDIDGIFSAVYVNLGANSHLRPHRGSVYKKITDHPLIKSADFKLNVIFDDKFSVVESAVPVLRCHLGLRVPEPDKCYLKIEDSILRWSEGEAFVFCDSFLHEAKNEGSQDRHVLLIDFDKRKYGFEPFGEGYPGDAKLIRE